MKKILAIVAVLLTVLFFESCTTDDMENTTPNADKVDSVKNPYTDAMMQRDTLSRDESSAIDPPSNPPIKP